ncbi:MAG: MliC family protein [Betaproteobacteria bacterium]
MNRRYARLPLMLLLLAAVAFSGCENPQKKKEEELAKNTFACQLNGERFVVRFVEGEARMLLPGAQRVTLYQLASTSGVRYSNGTMELRGKGTELQIITDGTVTPLRDCEPYAVLPPPK